MIWYCRLKALHLSSYSFRISANNRVLNPHGIVVFLYAILLVSIAQINSYNKLFHFTTRSVDIPVVSMFLLASLCMCYNDA